MTFDFDQIIDRTGTNALAEEGFEAYLFGEDRAEEEGKDASDLLRLWVADMQFATAPCVIDAIRKRLSHAILGYTQNFDDQFYDAFRAWSGRKYDWAPSRSSFFVSQGVIPALFTLVDCICAAGDKVMTLTPSYGYFKHAASHFGRELVSVPLQKDAGWDIDLDAFEAAARDPSVKLFFLCHPHNPTGQEWPQEKLMRMTNICLAHDVVIVSDEIHCDLLRVGGTHTPLAKLFPNEPNIITCMSPSKTFNLAGLMTAVVIIEDGPLQDLWKARCNPFLSPLGLAGSIAAYTDGKEWSDALRIYLDQNFAYLDQFLKDRLPKSNFSIPQATYLAWIDLGSYVPKEINLTNFFIEKAGVIVEGGEMFLDNANGQIRINLACPKSILVDAMERIAAAVDDAGAVSNTTPGRF